MSFWDDPVGTISDTASDWGGKGAGVWHDVSEPFVDNPFGRMAVNYATGGMAAPFYAAYDYSRGKKLSPMQIASAAQGASNMYDAYSGADVLTTPDGSVEGGVSAETGLELPPGAEPEQWYNVAGSGGWEDSMYSDGGGSIGGNYGSASDLQQNIMEADMGGYGGGDLTGISDYEGPASQGLSYGSFGGLKDLWTNYGKFAAPAAKVGAGLYDMYAKRRMAADMRQRAGDIENRISSYYAPNSPEAQLMRQRMERLDARAGRNSQYGVRETDLAAKLAQHRMQAYGQALPSLTSMYGGAGALQSGAEAGLFRTAGDILSNKELMGSLSDLF